MNNKYRKTAFLVSFVSASAVAFAEEKPNVILIMADDMGYECIGANGSTYNTPNINRLAKEGMRFENCHAQPLSTPSRNELMTGLYNNRNYIQFGMLDPKQRTFGNMAKECGYKTCIAGKWQLGADDRLPAVFGFDDYCLWQLTQPRRAGERYANVLYEENGKIMPRDIDQYGPDVFSKHVEDFIVAHKDEPFFVYYPMVLIHEPFYPTPDTDKWKDESLRQQKDNGNFPAVVEYADKVVGKLIDVLDKEGLRENTLLIFIGDNGTERTIYTPMKDGSVVKGGKGLTQKTGTHVPMIVSWPAEITPGQVNENLIDFSDFYPTLRDVFNADPEKDAELDGISFYKQLLGKKCKTREWSFCHYQLQNSINYVRFVQTVDYKLYPDGSFYNTRKDPEEKNNIGLGNGTKKEEKLRKKLNAVFVEFPAWGKEKLLHEHPLKNFGTGN